MPVRQLIPEDLADIAPGPELARVLAGLEPSRLSGFDSVEVLKAQYRQANHERARVLAVMAEVGLCATGPADDELARMPEPDEFSADEVRAALGLTRRAAEAQFWLAHDLVTRLPQVHAAMQAGTVDEPRARVFSEWTAELSAEQARAVCAELLPQVPKLTTGQLIERIKKLAIAVDPDWARRRYEQALADRKVVGYRNQDGSANLSGCNLPVDRVAAASGHIDALAKAAKRAGDCRPIDHVRAELFLGMTDGSYAGLDDAAIVELITTTATDEPEPDDRSGVGTAAPDQSTGTGTGTPPATDDPAPAPTPSPTPAPTQAVGAATRGPVQTLAGTELRVRVSTLLGRDRYPAELAGWGPVHAELARDLTATLAAAQWRFAVTGEDGQLAHCGTTLARPVGFGTRSATCRAVVELQITAGTLRALAADLTTAGPWAVVVTDLTRQLDRHPPHGEDGTRRHPALPRFRAAPLPGMPRPILRHDRLPGARPHQRSGPHH